MMETMMPVSVVVWLFARMTDWGELVISSAWLPKFTVLGVRETTDTAIGTEAINASARSLA
jgi:hypothetical protein